MNTLGHQFKVSSFGESHGEFVGCVVEGCPAGLLVDIDAMQHQVNRRKTHSSDFSSSRQEPDQLKIISGIYEGKTLGSPIAILIENKDAKSSDYDVLKDLYRPGHADFSYQMKYGVRDARGGGRSSIRITAPLVAAGELANQLLHYYFPIKIKAYVSAIGQSKLSSKYDINLAQIDSNEVRCPDENTARAMRTEIEVAMQSGDTLGGEISCIISGLPKGLGEPVFGKLQAQLAHTMMNINTAKAFEYGMGTRASDMKGSEHNDTFLVNEGQVRPASNRHGGILGGISTGEDVYFSVSFKPISSIQQEQTTMTMQGEQTQLNIKGRHDVCAVPRAVPIVEAYASIVLADLLLISKSNTL
jgi:chorismate synthase